MARRAFGPSTGAARRAGFDRSGVWMRRAGAAAAAALGVLDISLAASRRAPRPFAAPDLHYALAAVVGARYYLLAAGLCLLMVTRGLLRAQRTAWLLACIAAGVSAPAFLVKHGDVVGAGLAAFTLLLLLIGGRDFRAASNPLLLRRGVTVLLVGEAGVLAYALIGLYSADRALREQGTVAQTLRTALRLLFLLPVELGPTDHHIRMLVDSVRLAGLIVAVIAMAMLIATVSGRPGLRSERRRVEALLERYATGALTHFMLLEDKNWLIGADGQAVIAYVVQGRCAVALGDPVGAEGSLAPVAVQFRQMCERNGWTPVFHQLSPTGAALMPSAGLVARKIGEEAVIDLPSWSLEGRQWKQVRSALRRCERAGYRAVALPHPLDALNLARLREVSDAWLADGDHRERRFTLGRFDPAYLRTTPVLAIVDATDTVQAFANVLPAYRSKDRTFDLMRRRPDAVNGVMDMLFVALIERFRAEGADGMNLGLAPLAGLEAETGAAGRVMRLAYERGGAVFRYAGLRAFKDKWHPRWEPRYIGVGSEAQLPKAAAAIARAGELPDPRSAIGRVRAFVAAFPFTVAFAAVQLWVMAAGQIDPHVHAQLLQASGSSWPTIVHGQLWRFLTSPLIQTSPGFLWSNIKLFVLVIPLAEWRLGTRRAIGIYFLGDLISSVPALIILKAAAVQGSEVAQRLINLPDGGTSAGSWALWAAIAWTLPTRPLRLAATGLVLFLLADAAWDHQRLFDFQHLGSAVGAILLLEAGRWWSARRDRVLVSTQ